MWLELKAHAKFTLLGAFIAIVLMFFLRSLFPTFLGSEQAEIFFEFTHPLHVVVSAMVTAIMYKNYKKQDKTSVSAILAIVLVGYFGSIGIATISDSLIPFMGEKFLRLEQASPHLMIFEKPLLINFSAFLGIILGFCWVQTKAFHSLHVFLSTLASLFHIMIALEGGLAFFQFFGVFIFLFLSVWLPCCLSDIVVPLVFIDVSKIQTKALVE